MKIPPTLLKHSFGACASIAIAAAFWLSTTTVYYCHNVNEGIDSHSCKSDVLITFLIQRQAWPYHHTPFVGYWDSYDNKLASIVYEPYSQLTLAAGITFLAWLAFVTYVGKGHEGRIATIRK